MMLGAQLQVTQTGAEQDLPLVSNDAEIEAQDEEQTDREEMSVQQLDPYSVLSAAFTGDPEEKKQGRVGISQTTFVKTAKVEPDRQSWWDTKI